MILIVTLIAFLTLFWFLDKWDLLFEALSGEPDSIIQVMIWWVVSLFIAVAIKEAAAAPWV